MAVIKRLLLLCLVCCHAKAAVLPDERADLMYHSYDGGGVSIDGPSLLVRKNVGQSVSLAANYYVDMVSSASIDVVTNGKQGVDVMSNASSYSEERREHSLSLQYLVDRSVLSAGYSASKEGDYDAKTYSLGIEQSFFGDLTTLGFAVSLGDDQVGNNYNASYRRDLQRRKYSINASQILTKNLLFAVSYDAATDQCLHLGADDSCLNNPYRQYRYRDGAGYAWRAERYPHTRNSDAVGLRAIYRMPWRASLRGEYRVFKDSWGIEASNYELRYTHAYQRNWLIEGKLRWYDQGTGADFYSDLFTAADAQNYVARDKELSPFTSLVIGLGASYTLPKHWLPWGERSTANLYWDHFRIDYDDFRDLRVNALDYSVGSEPLYRLDANVIRLYLSVWY